MPFSTDSVLPYVWPVEDLSPTMIAGMLKVSSEVAIDHRRRFATHQRDRAWLDATLARLSAPAVCTIAVLADRGGMLHVSELDAVAMAMFGLTGEEVDAGVNELLPLLLIAPLVSPRGNALALVAPAADHLAARVSGLELVPLAGELVPDAEHDGGRALVAAAMAMATADLKLTQSHAPHRTRLKNLAKQFGVDAVRLETLIMAAFDVGLVNCDEDGILVPDRERLIAACEGRYPHAPALDRLAAAVGDGEAVSAEAIAGYANRRGLAISASVLNLLPTFRTGTIAKTRVVGVVQTSGVAAASVTPSFEVFLPPESRSRHLVDVLGACELVRIDRAIVARITKASIMAAVARGLTGDELLAALSGATRTPLPQNVAAAIRDWTGSTVTATIASGRVIVVPPADQARVVAALAFAEPAVVAPGVIVVSADEPERRITAALRKLGIFERAPTPEPSPRSRPPIPAVEHDSQSGASAALRARVNAYCRSTAAQRAPLIARLVAPSLHRAQPSNPSRPNNDFDEISTIALRLERWEHDHDSLLDVGVYEALVDAIVMLSSHERQFVFKATTPADLGNHLASVLNGDRIARLDPDTIAVLEQGLSCQLGTRAGPELDWHRDHTVARLEAAVRTQATVVVEHGQRIRTIAVSKLVQRGGTLMLLGDDESGQGVAIRVTEIRGLADPALGSTKKWRPAPGMTPPPGHARCPCGSNLRYRDCCRGDVAQA